VTLSQVRTASDIDVSLRYASNLPRRGGGGVKKNRTRRTGTGTQSWVAQCVNGVQMCLKKCGTSDFGCYVNQVPRRAALSLLSARAVADESHGLVSVRSQLVDELLPRPGAHAWCDRTGRGWGFGRPMYEVQLHGRGVWAFLAQRLGQPPHWRGV